MPSLPKRTRPRVACPDCGKDVGSVSAHMPFCPAKAETGAVAVAVAERPVEPQLGYATEGVWLPASVHAEVVAALKFYADAATYERAHAPDCVPMAGDPENPHEEHGDTCGYPAVLRDDGSKARTALAACEGGEK